MGKGPSHKGKPSRTPQWAKEQMAFERSRKYPFCKGTFPDCPKEISKDVPPECKICPIYRK